MGLNGVDNGRLAFNDVRVPRDALLDRYGTIDENGVYTSPIEKRDPPLLHDARHAGPGSGLRLRSRTQRVKGRTRHRDPLRPRPAAVPRTGQ